MDDYAYVYPHRPQSGRIFYLSLSRQQVFLKTDSHKLFFIVVCFKVHASKRSFPDQEASLRKDGFVEPDEQYPFFRLREDRCVDVNRPSSESSESLNIEIEFTSIGIATLWPAALQCEPEPGIRMYKLGDTLHKKVIDCYGRMLCRLFV